MTSLTFYGGVAEIGGNKFLLEDDKTRVFLDFGLSFSLVNKFFDEFMQPRKCNGLKDLFEFNLLPDLKGLYRRDYLIHSHRKPPVKPAFDGVLLSHAHMDHCSHIHYLREDIPVYCTRGSKDIMTALDETGSTGFSELIYLRDSFKTYVNKKGGVSRLTGEKTKKEREYHIIDNKRFKVNNLEVEAHPVNHSLEGASAFIVHSSVGPVVYTGDFRFHGYGGGFSRDFVKRAAEAEPKILLLEGTRVDSDKADSEQMVRDAVLGKVDETNELVVVNFPVRDTDRMISFHEVAKQTGRSLVVNLKQAYLLDLFERSGIRAPRLSDEHIRVYIPRKSWGVYGDERFPDNIQLQDYARWERDFLGHSNAVTYHDIKKDQSMFIFRCDFFELKELIDIKPNDGSCYIRSVCEPFDVEMRLDLEKVENWLKHFGLFPYTQVHASGHLNGVELREVIKQIQPEILIPIHTEHPEIFTEFHDNVLLPKIGEKFSF